METLEIKHLAAYLPYKIKIRVFRENESLFIEDVEITGEVIDYIFETKEYSKYKYKPILRPLSDINTEFCKKHNISFTHRFWSDLKFNEGSEKEGCSDYFTFKDCQVLAKHHFDLFNLIDKGLAVNINELEAVGV